MVRKVLKMTLKLKIDVTCSRLASCSFSVPRIIHPNHKYNHFPKIFKMSALSILDAKDVEAAKKSTPGLPITVEFT